MRVAVVGHMEWVEFLAVDHVPAPGEIVHAVHRWEEPAGGGGVAAVQLAKLAGSSTMFTGLGHDELGRRSVEGLEAMGVHMEVAFRTDPTRRAVTFVDSAGERTITTIGPRLEAHGDDPLSWDLMGETDAAFFTAGDVAALAHARGAKVLVATLRVRELLAEAGIQLDAVVGSARDRDERYVPGAIQPPPRLVVLTDGAAGGTYRVEGGPSGTYRAAPVPGPVADAYGAGDSFQAGLTYALGARMPLEAALAFAARCGAACMTGHGPYQGQLRLVDGAEVAGISSPA